MQPSDLSPGTVVAQRFVIEELAGSGGMGAVYRAHDLLSGRKVALKLLYGRSIQQRDLERFAREAQLLAELHHPGIVSYLAHGQSAGGIPYLAMQWLDGEDLSIRLERSRLTPRETLIVLEKAADALAAAHRVGIIHREPSHCAISVDNPDIRRGWGKSRGRQAPLLQHLSRHYMRLTVGCAS
jgi:eukaryotic-like serine/threonine-protein kinase